MVDDGRFAALESSRDTSDHYGFLYGSRREQLDVVVPFLQRGLDRGDRIVYVVDDATPAEISAALRAAGVDVQAARESGRLTFCDAADVYLTDGEFDQDAAVARVKALADDASDEYAGLRIAAEMTGSLLERIDSENVLAYEAEIDCLFEGIDLVGLCQYDRSSIPRSFLESVIESHPQLAYDGVVGSNDYYSDPSTAADGSEPNLAEKLEQHRRTVSDRQSLRRAERGLTTLACATEQVLWAEPDAVPEIVVDATQNALDCDHAALWLYDRKRDDLFRRHSSSSGPVDRLGDLRSFEDLAWEAFLTNDEQHWRSPDRGRSTDVADRTARFERHAEGFERSSSAGRSADASERSSADKPADAPDPSSTGTSADASERPATAGSRSAADLVSGGGPFSAAVALPLAGTGALVAATSTAPHVDREAVEIGRALAGVGSVAFEKARQGSRIEDLQEERTRLAAVESLVRDLVREATDASCRRDVERALCDALAAIDDVAFVWTGTVDPDDGTATPHAWAGEQQDSVASTVLGDRAPPPVVDAVASSEPTVVDDIADEQPDASWSQAALDRGFRSLASVPLCDGRVTYGAVTTYASRPEAFSDVLGGALADVGQFVGYLLQVVDRDVSLRTGTAREVELELSSPEFPFVELAAQLECTVALEDVVAHGDQGVVAVGRLPDDASDRIPGAADATDGIESATVVEESDDGVLLDLTLSEAFVGAALSAHGASVSSLTADPESARVVVETPASVGERTVVELVAEEYSTPTLLATRSTSGSDPLQASPTTVGSQFTDRQQQVAAVAYHVGYFDSPRRCTGEEVADVLDISPQAFYQHIRRMERTLFDQVVEGA